MIKPGPIHKQILNPSDAQVEVPGVPVSLGNQKDTVALWYVANGSRSIVRLYPTGQTPSIGSRFIGTALLYGGELVLHAFADDPVTPL